VPVKNHAGTIDHNERGHWDAAKGNPTALLRMLGGRRILTGFLVQQELAQQPVLVQ
jgi:hypothetical protein